MDRGRGIRLAAVAHQTKEHAVIQAKTKRLALHAQTVRLLSNKQMTEIQGGRNKQTAAAETSGCDPDA